MAICNQSLREQGKPYPRTCAVCGLGPCRMLQPGFEMKDMRDPFSSDELLALAGNAEAQKFMMQAATQWTVGQLRAEVRRKFLLPAPISEQLDNLLGGWAQSEMGMMQLSATHREIIMDAIQALRNAEKTTIRRPVEDLGQEPWRADRDGRGGSPYRWVILWAPSGYNTVEWRCEVGRRAPPGEKFAGKFVTHSGECFTDGGEDATHFSELPFDA